MKAAKHLRKHRCEISHDNKVLTPFPVNLQVSIARHTPHLHALILDNVITRGRLTIIALIYMG
jgi:hypothetical protein